MATKRSASSCEPITVVVSDVTPLGCELLSLALARSSRLLNVLASAAQSSALLRHIAEHKPDIAFVSANLQDGALAGLDVVRQLRQHHPQTRAVVLLDNRDRGTVVEAFRAGAKGIMVRSGSLDHLIKCIVAVHNGQIWAEAHELHYLLEELAQPNGLRVMNCKGEILLTSREEQIVSAVTEGLTNRAIAEQLQLSGHTVKNYLFRIYDKLGVSNRAELILYAMNNRKAAVRSSQAA